MLNSDLMDTIFDGLQAELLGFVEYGSKGDPTQSLSMLVAIENQSESCEGSDQEFAINVLEFLGNRLEKMFERFLVSLSSKPSSPVSSFSLVSFSPLYLIGRTTESYRGDESYVQEAPRYLVIYSYFPGMSNV